MSQIKTIHPYIIQMDGISTIDFQRFLSW